MRKIGYWLIQLLGWMWFVLSASVIAPLDFPILYGSFIIVLPWFFMVYGSAKCYLDKYQESRG